MEAENLFPFLWSISVILGLIPLKKSWHCPLDDGNVSLHRFMGKREPGGAESKCLERRENRFVYSMHWVHLRVWPRSLLSSDQLVTLLDVIRNILYVSFWIVTLFWRAVDMITSASTTSVSVSTPAPTLSPTQTTPLTGRVDFYRWPGQIAMDRKFSWSDNFITLIWSLMRMSDNSWLTTSRPTPTVLASDTVSVCQR